MVEPSQLIMLSKSLQAWNSENGQNHTNFKTVFIYEVEQLEGHLLPLQVALRYSNYAVLDEFKTMVISIQETDRTLEIKTGIAYNGVVAGCNCVDDPTPLNEQTEFCECLFKIDKQTAQTTIQLIEN